MRPSIPVALAVALAGAAAAAGTTPSRVRLILEPRTALVDAPLTLRVEGLGRGQEVTIRAGATDGDGRRWRSEATFRAGASGVLDPALDAPQTGTYAGVEAMGLFWSLRPEPSGTAPAPARGAAPIQDLLVPPAGTAFPRPASGAIDVRIEVVAGGRTVAEGTAVRSVTGADVKVTEVRAQGLVGRAYEPSGARGPAVLVLGGSNGGVPALYAPVLAGHGYAVFALAYFRAEGLPNDLVEIPVEYLRRGLDWLAARPSVDPGRIAVLGVSRGGEAALLLASRYPEVKAVAALAPSHVVWEGAVRDPARKGLEALRAGRSAWTLGGQPLPFVPKTITAEMEAAVAAGRRFQAIDFMQLGSVDLLVADRARIPVENIGGPVFLLSSLSDRMWPAAAMSDRVAEALRAHPFGHRVEHLQYDGLAHLPPDAWLPPAHGGTLGGTAEGTMRAYARYWPALLSFLESSLRRPR